MNPTALALSATSIALAYLIGAIPFGYLVALWARGVDIRTVGSGNVGATNVGRVLGFRYFLLVFALDVLKGLLPTLGLPRLVEGIAGEAPSSLAVLVALATILGHNFPIYLKLRGGKGVATSLGALLALDPIAIGAAFFGFLVVLVIGRWVSLSSILAAVIFVGVHFSRVEAPFGREQIAMTLMTAALFAMLVVRHRSNIKRILDGTEPKVPIRWPRRRRSGRVGLLIPIALAAAAVTAGAGLTLRMNEQTILDCGAFTLEELTLATTGHQRANDLTFADEGRLLVVSCPRYNRIVFYRVTDGEALEVLRDVALEARPVALEATADRVYVLQRPTGDARHMEEAYWETFDFAGSRVGSKFRVGWDPDDLAVRPGLGLAFVLTSGHAEGETGRPDPALIVVRLGEESRDHEIQSRLSFDRPGDDPEKLILSESGGAAVVTLPTSGEIVSIDLSDPDQPAAIGRNAPPASGAPYYSESGDGDRILMPTGTGREAVALSLPDPMRPGEATEYFVTTLPEGSGLEVVIAETRRPLGILPLRGPGNFGSVDPTGLAYSPDRGLLAVSNRAGGIHLIAVRDQAQPSGQALASSGRGAPTKIGVYPED